MIEPTGSQTGSELIRGASVSCDKTSDASQ